MALSWVLLGPFYALIRPLAAFVSAVTAGLLVGVAGGSCLSRGAALPVVSPGAACTAGCCAASPPAKGAKGFLSRAWAGVVYAFTELLDDLALWLSLGILGAAAVVTLVPPNLLAQWGSGPVAMMLIMLVSVPMYVCATASTPLAHAMLFAGVSPGTVLVFLLAGPASNLAGIALVRREMGGRALSAYLFGVGGVSLLLGLLLDGVIGVYGLQALFHVGAGGAAGHESPSALAWTSLLLLLVLGAKPLRRYLSGGRGGAGGCCG